MNFIDISLDTALELDNIISGVFNLKRFLNSEEYLSVIKTMRLPNNMIWPIPIVLPISKNVNFGTYILRHDGVHLAEIEIEEKYPLYPETEAIFVYGTNSLDHPGVKKIKERLTYAGTGPIKSLTRMKQPYQFDPVETRQIFKNNGWKKIVGFQTRNPIHRAHEYVLKSSLETVDGLFINPLSGPQKDGDIPASTRLKTYEVLIEKYFNPKNVFLGVYPAPMYYAGPREAILHALVRKQYGCTHFIVGRDHAGVGSYYGPFDAQKLVDSVEDELGIQVIKFDKVFYDKNSNSMGSSKTMPDGFIPAEISGTKLRELLKTGQEIPEGISRPEILEILKKYYKELDSGE